MEVSQISCSSIRPLLKRRSHPFRRLRLTCRIALLSIRHSPKRQSQRREPFPIPSQWVTFNSPFPQKAIAICAERSGDSAMLVFQFAIPSKGDRNPSQRWRMVGTSFLSIRHSLKRRSQPDAPPPRDDDFQFAIPSKGDRNPSRCKQGAVSFSAKLLANLPLKPIPSCR